MYILSALIGVGFGSFYTTSRALLVKISPPEKLGEYFGFYSTFQKFASIIGPVTYGGITLALNSYGTFKYRAAFFALSVLMLIGTLILLKVKEERLKI
jgi:UMF1 family MFS transporter